MDFNDIPYDEITWGKRLGGGSFGSVFKVRPSSSYPTMVSRVVYGSYLGIDIAIKEIRPSKKYEVKKYFEREWRIMRECRHPNIVLFLGLCRSPEDDTVYIVSEFVPRGNLRQYLLSSHPLPWRLRLSFATDVARAVAYLHAREAGCCFHRDLKGENLLITSNERVKVTDFGFARIASRNDAELSRMTFCGTDGYMSPEIIKGHEFGLSTDVFSLGIIFIEILSRKVVDSKTYVRSEPSYTPDPAEVRRRASPGCPPALIDLALQCCSEEPGDRPEMPEVLARLRHIEIEVINMAEESAEHVGSVKLIKQTGNARGMPDFNPPGTSDVAAGEAKAPDEPDEEETARLERDALESLAQLDVSGGGASTVTSSTGTWRTARWADSALDLQALESGMTGRQPLLNPVETSSSESVVPASSIASNDTVIARPIEGAPALHDAEPYDDILESSITVKPTPGQQRNRTATPYPPGAYPTSDGDNNNSSPAGTGKAGEATPKAHGGTHRFTLVDRETMPAMGGKKASGLSANFAFAFLKNQLENLGPSTMCPVCHRRLGGRPALQCDDCDNTHLSVIGLI